jgi:hypothetical protein
MPDIITDQRAPRIPVQAIRERLGRLTSDQLEAGMIFLSGYDPAAFDIVIHAARTWDTSHIPDPAAAPAAG